MLGPDGRIRTKTSKWKVLGCHYTIFHTDFRWESENTRKSSQLRLFSQFFSRKQTLTQERHFINSKSRKNLSQKFFSFFSSSFILFSCRASFFSSRLFLLSIYKFLRFLFTGVTACLLVLVVELHHFMSCSFPCSTEVVSALGHCQKLR